MALGGGTFIAQNKVLPGSYINFISLANASATLSTRGIAAMAIDADWGESGKVIKVTSGDFQKHSMKIFGYDYTDPKLKGLRDLFANIHTLFTYRLNGEGGKKATNDLATAKYNGIRGNDIKIAIEKDGDKFAVKTVVGTAIADVQTVKEIKELVANDYVTFAKEGKLVATAGKPLTGGTNGVSNTAGHQEFLNKVECKAFNALGCVSTDDATKKLYVAYAKRLRDEVGKKFQCVLFNEQADYEGVVNVKNEVTDGNTIADLVYWVTGVIAGTAVNRSALNLRYNGEYDVTVDFTQDELKEAITKGEFTLHQVDDDIRVLNDINSLVTVTSEKGDIFKDNQTIRICDQIANDIAVLFNTKYLGTVPNDASGRISLWADIVQHHTNLQDIRAIENFEDKDVVVEQGETKKAVVVGDYVQPVNSMEKLYMTVTIQ